MNACAVNKPWNGDGVKIIDAIMSLLFSDKAAFCAYILAFYIQILDKARALCNLKLKT